MHRPTLSACSPGGAIVLTAASLLLSPLAGYAQDGRGGAPRTFAKAMGAASVKSIQYSGSGRELPGRPELQPGHAVAAVHRQELHAAVNYENASIRDELVRTQGENPPRGAVDSPSRVSSARSSSRAATLPGTWWAKRPNRRRSHWSIGSSAVDHATRVVKAAMANNATVQGRTISFTAPGRFKVQATIDTQNLVEKIVAVARTPCSAT